MRFTKNHVIICSWYTQYSIWKIDNVIYYYFSPFSAVDLNVVWTLYHERLVDHFLLITRTYILLFICSYLDCDKGDRHHLYQHSPYIYVPEVRIFLYTWIACFTPRSIGTNELSVRMNKCPWQRIIVRLHGNDPCAQSYEIIRGGIYPHALKAASFICVSLLILHEKREGYSIIRKD